MNLISPGPALRFRTPKANWGQGGIHATALRGPSKSGPGRTHEHFHHFKPKEQMPFCNVAWQTSSTNIRAGWVFIRAVRMALTQSSVWVWGHCPCRFSHKTVMIFTRTSCPVTPLIFERISLPHIEFCTAASLHPLGCWRQSKYRGMWQQHLLGQ